MNIQIVPKIKSGIVFRPITESDVPALVVLYSLCFGDRPSEHYIRWRYFRTPVGTAPAMGAFDNNLCVASFMFWPMRMLLDGKSIMAVEGSDAMTHPEYRGRGLFMSLVEKGYQQIATRGYQFFFALPNDISLPIAMRHLNWDHVCDVPRWVRPLWILGTSPLSGLAAATSLLWSPNSAKELHTVTTAPGPGSVAALVARCEKEKIKIKTKGACRVKRGWEWFAWRYHPDSDKNYQWAATYDGTQLRAVAVWRFDRKIRRIYLCELIGDPQSIPTVLKFVLRAAFGQKARAIEFPTTDPDLIPMLKSSGFIQRRGHPFVVRSCTDKLLPANIHSSETWRVYGGDFDYF